MKEPAFMAPDVDYVQTETIQLGDGRMLTREMWRCDCPEWRSLDLTRCMACGKYRTRKFEPRGAPLPRAVCPGCGGTHAVRVGGELWKHPCAETATNP